MNKYKGLYHQFCTSIYKLENAQKYVEDTIRKVDWNSYAISKHIPRSIRQDYLNICQFHNELARIEETTKEKSLGAGKLQFWANAIDQIFEDKPPKEPLAICLHHTCKSNPLPKYLFTKMITFKLRQIEQPEFMNLSQMALAAETNRGPQFLLVLRLLRQDIEDPILKQTVELASQSVGITDFIKRVPFTLQNYKLQLPEDIKYKHSINVRNLWDRIKGKPKEELYDAILEVAAFSRNIMIQSAQFQSQLPPQAFRAFLHLSAAEYYLEQLEYYNFNVFEKSINQNSYVQLPLRIFQNCRNSKYLSNDYP